MYNHCHCGAAKGCGLLIILSIFLLIWSLPYIYWLFASGVLIVPVLIVGIVWILMPERY